MIPCLTQAWCMSSIFQCSFSSQSSFHLQIKQEWIWLQDYCYNPSVASVLSIHLLTYDEMCFYQICRMMHKHLHERRDWWQHVRQLNDLAFHSISGMGQRSWNCFAAWRVSNIHVATPSPSESTSNESDSVYYDPWDDSNTPLCEHCGLLRCIGHSMTKELMSVRCFQRKCNDQVDRLLGQPAQESSSLQPTHPRTSYPWVHVSWCSFLILLLWELLSRMVSTWMDLVSIPWC